MRRSRLAVTPPLQHTNSVELERSWGHVLRRQMLGCAKCLVADPRLQIHFQQPLLRPRVVQDASLAHEPQQRLHLLDVVLPRKPVQEMVECRRVRLR